MEEFVLSLILACIHALVRVDSQVHAVKYELVFVQVIHLIVRMEQLVLKISHVLLVVYAQEAITALYAIY
jgi:hypothetical protein